MKKKNFLGFGIGALLGVLFVLGICRVCLVPSAPIENDSTWIGDPPIDTAFYNSMDSVQLAEYIQAKVDSLD